MFCHDKFTSQSCLIHFLKWRSNRGQIDLAPTQMSIDLVVAITRLCPRVGANETEGTPFG